MGATTCLIDKEGTVIQKWGEQIISARLMIISKGIISKSGITNRSNKVRSNLINRLVFLDVRRSKKLLTLHILLEMKVEHSLRTCEQAIHFASRGMISANIQSPDWFIFFMFALCYIVSFNFNRVQIQVTQTKNRFKIILPVMKI